MPTSPHSCKPQIPAFEHRCEVKLAGKCHIKIYPVQKYHLLKIRYSVVKGSKWSRDKHVAPQEDFLSMNS